MTTSAMHRMVRRQSMMTLGLTLLMAASSSACGLTNATVETFFSPEPEPEPQAACASGEHDGGDGVCVPLQTCTIGFSLAREGGVCFQVSTRANIPGTAGAQYSATLLGNREILVVGGFDPLVPADIGTRPMLRYTIETNQWESGRPLGRFGHRAVVVDPQTVLIIGGATSYTTTVDVTTSLEVGSEIRASDVAAMQEAREGHSATLLDDGRIVVVGGGLPDTKALASIEIFDGQAWTTLSSALPDGRAYHTATLLDDGRILVVGGSINVELIGEVSSSVYLVDVDEASVSTLTSMAVGRAEHTATLRPDGTVLVAGGRDSLGAPLASTEVFLDGEMQSFDARGLGAGRLAHSASLISGGRVLISGGNEEDLNGAFASRRLTVLDADGVAFDLGDLPTGLSVHPAIVMNDRRTVFLVGGSGASLFLDPPTSSVFRVRIGE